MSKEINDNSDKWSTITQVFKFINSQDLQELIKKYYSIFSYIVDNHLESTILSYFEDNKNPEKDFINAIKKYYLNNYSLIFKSQFLPDFLIESGFNQISQINRKEDLNNISEKTIILDRGIRELFEIFGIENIKRFDEETGFFTASSIHKTGLYLLLDNINILKKYIPESLKSFKNGNISYDEFKDKFAILLGKIRYLNLKGHTYIDYSYMKGKFRSVHKELFISEDAPPELLFTFYRGTINLSMLHNKKASINFLTDKNLVNTINANIFLKTHDGQQLNFLEAARGRVRNIVILNILAMYGKALEGLTIEVPNINDLTEENIEKFVQESLYNYIVNNYKHTPKSLLEVPSFLTNYPELFISDDAPYDLKSLFYDDKSNIHISDIKKHPEWINYLKDKNLRFLTSSTNIPLKSFLDRYGNEKFLMLYYNYGKYLERAALEASKDLKKVNDEKSFIDIIENKIEEKFLKKEISYSGDLPKFLLEKYHLGLNDSSPEYVKEALKGSALTIKILSNNPKLYNYLIENVNIASIFDSSYYWIISLFNKEKNLKEANIKKLKVIILYSQLKNNFTGKLLKEYVIKNQNNLNFDDLNALFENYIKVTDEYNKLTDIITKKHFEDYIKDNQDNIDFNKLNELTKILVQISTGNSLELLSLEKPLINAVLSSSDPKDVLKKIENIFIKNNLPLFAKVFLCFKIIYPTMDFLADFSDDRKKSLNLTDKYIKRVGRARTNAEARFNMIFNDLLRIAVHTKNRNLVDYLDNIEKGEIIYKELANRNKTFLDLTKEEVNILTIFVDHLTALYENTKEGKNLKIDIDKMSLENKLWFLSKRFKPTDRVDLKDRIIRSFAYFAGYKSFDELKKDTFEYIEKANERNKEAASKLGNNDFILEKGDLIRGIGDYTAFSNSLESGNVSNEFLSMFTGTSLSDTTPLDIDFGSVSTNGLAHNVIPGIVRQTEIMLVVKKNNPAFYLTRDEKGNIYDRYDPKKGELFTTLAANHYGIRTGMAFTEVDYILYNQTKRDHLNIIKYELARNGLYIPVVNYKTNKLIFTYDEYEMIRKKMQGLSYYGQETYDFSPNILNDEALRKIDEIKAKKNDIKTKKDIYLLHVRSVLKKHGIKLFTEITGELEKDKAEFIDIGSTGRGTNIPGGGDFDFVLKLDQKIISDNKKLAKLQRDLRSFYISCDEKGSAKGGNFRDKGVLIPGLDKKIDIDITFMPRTDKIAYSTDECIKDRLRTLKRLDKRKYELTVANIILAKELFKGSKVYKSLNEGGLGGVGVETWILTNGGSLLDAARSFLKASEGKSLTEFQKAYPLYNFGDNHRVLEDKIFGRSMNQSPFIHNDFINNLTPSGYQKMREVLNIYIKNINAKNPIKETLKEINPNEYIDKDRYTSSAQIKEDSQNILNMVLGENIKLNDVYLGQTGYMYEYTLNNKKYLVKPGVNKNDLEVNPVRAAIQEAASRIQKLITPSTSVDVKVYGRGSVKVAVQEKIPNAKRKSDIYLITNHTKELIGEYVCDYLLGNFDSDASNFIIDENNHLRGIDKEQSLKHIDYEDYEKSLSLDFSYMPKESRLPIYPALLNYLKTAENKEELLDYLKQILNILKNVDDDYYLNIFKEYAYISYSSNQEELLSRILYRKKYFEENIEIFIADLIKNKQK